MQRTSGESFQSLASVGAPSCAGKVEAAEAIANNSNIRAINFVDSEFP